MYYSNFDYLNNKTDYQKLTKKTYMETFTVIDYQVNKIKSTKNIYGIIEVYVTICTFKKLVSLNIKIYVSVQNLYLNIVFLKYQYSKIKAICF